jgi:hypothetical protein
MRAACLLMALLVSPAAACIARSGERTAALVELYTSAGCKACVPAERWLAGLSEQYPSERVVPVTLQVSQVAPPPRRLTPLQRLALVPMPHVLVQGMDFARWHTDDFGREIARLNATPARAWLELEILSRGAGALKVRARASSDLQADLFVGTQTPRDWQGPLALGQHEIEVPHEAAVVAFVQDRRTGEVLQALRLGLCFP